MCPPKTFQKKKKKKKKKIKQWFIPYSSSGGSAYLYEFTHAPSFSNESIPVHGDDLLFSLGFGLQQNTTRGQPLSISGLSVMRPLVRAQYNRDEVALTQDVMTYWTNFAKTG